MLICCFLCGMKKNSEGLEKAQLNPDRLPKNGLLGAGHVPLNLKKAFRDDEEADKMIPVDSRFSSIVEN